MTAHFLIAGKPHPQIQSGLDEAGALTHVLPDFAKPTKGQYCWPFFWKFSELMGRHNFRVAAFHFCNEIPVVLAVTAARLRMRSPPTRFIWHQHSQIEPPGRRPARYVSRLRAVSLAVDGVCTVYRQAGLVVKARGIPARKVHTIYNGVDSMPVSASQIHAKREELGVPPGAQMLFSASSLIPRKNLTMMLLGFAAARPKVGDLRLVIAGDGAQALELRACAEALGLTGYVQFLGQRSDVRELIAASDACLLTADSEALPFFCLEAFAQGRVLISTPAGGVPEIIADGENGLLVPFNDPQGLSAALCRVFTDGALRTRLETTAQESFRRSFSLDAMVENYFRYYFGVTVEEAAIADSAVVAARA